mgnify:CR=1 FL=1
MKARKLGNELTVSSIGFGCMGLSHAYGVALEKDTAIRRIHEAFEKGYTFFDTAEAYGHRGIEESKNKSFSANWRKK